MSQKSKSLIGGISILGLAGLICKVVGVLYRIPLAAYIGGEGLGIYQKVFPAYNLLLTISSAGIPVAISRMVSHYVTCSDPRSAKRIFRVAAWALTALGAVATVLLIAASGYLANESGTAEAKAGYIAIAPSLFLVCVMSAFRGYMQGHRHMLPTAVSQLIEQVGKVAVALPLAVIGMKKGGPGYGAAGALLGTSIAEGAALLYMMATHVRAKKDFSAIQQDASASLLSGKTIGKRLLAISVPITLGACIVPLAGLIDSFMLTELMEKGGMEAKEALVRYGLYSGMVITLINVPTALAMAMSTNLVPAISAALAKNDRARAAGESATGLRVAVLVGFPCSVGMSLLAKPLLYLFYSSSYTAAQLNIAAELLSVSAMTIVLFTVVQATSGILQGCGKQRIPMYTLMAGVVFKVILNYVLVGIPGFDIHGAPIASLVCYTVSMVPNLYYVVRYTGCRFSAGDLIARPGAATLLMGAVVYALWHFVFTEKTLSAGRFTLLIAVIVCVGAGIAVYAVGAVALKAVKKEDVPARVRRLIWRK
ncbi:MAG: polysaccharide biosynthesis protein [Clostridia bacterium]|nr:polysaccharide biosynthesis protein [Clostridia bacterium]